MRGRELFQLAHLEQEALRLRPAPERLHVGEGREHPLLQGARRPPGRPSARGSHWPPAAAPDGLSEADGRRAGHLLRALHGALPMAPISARPRPPIVTPSVVTVRPAHLDDAQVDATKPAAIWPMEAVMLTKVR